MFIFRKRAYIRRALYLMLFSTIVSAMLLLPSNVIAQKNNGSVSIGISAYSAILVDVESGRILYQKNIDQRMRIASLTKIMTAIIAIENGDLDSVVTTSDNAFGTEGSSIYLKKGEKLKLEDMLYGLMMRSGNDAAVAIAEHIGNSVEGFAYLMNEKAAYLGMNNSHFMNPHGLDHKEHYSTARDMALLTAYALKNPVFKKIVSTKVKTAPLEGEAWDRKWTNKNKMLSMYPYADGVKTGYTKLAKRCLASSATKDGVQLVTITLNDSNDWQDSMRLFDFGFEQYKSTALIERDSLIQDISANYPEYKVVADNTFKYPLKKDEFNQIAKKVYIDKNVEFKDEKQIGFVKFYLHGDYIGSVPIKVYRVKETFVKKIDKAWKQFLGDF